MPSSGALALLASTSPWVLSRGQPTSCSPGFTIPTNPPVDILSYLGLDMQEVCLGSAADEKYSAYIIGDWGGVKYSSDLPLMPADKRSKMFPAFRRKFVWGVDDCAQQKVAQVMEESVSLLRPDYILNVGDNFYWGGVEGTCGAPPMSSIDDQSWSSQWTNIFENIYTGALQGIPWLGVLGNHDYGGFKFTAKWAEAIGYTWANQGRWLQPSLYWGQVVWYPDFSVQYLFVDTNAAEAWLPELQTDHNLCGIEHNDVSTCGSQGPRSTEECHHWFFGMWQTQFHWMTQRLHASDKLHTYQVIVTHFPPKWFSTMWQCLTNKFGIDLFISGHVHQQLIYAAGETTYLPETCVVISGGGGGITSENTPDEDGNDDQYGFVHMELSKEKLGLNAISHGKQVRKQIECFPRPSNPSNQCDRDPQGRKLADLPLEEIMNMSREI